MAVSRGLQYAALRALHESNSSKSSSLSISSDFKASDFHNLIMKNAKPYIDTNTRFRYRTKDTINQDGTKKTGNLYTSKPTHYLQLDTDEVYFTVSPNRSSTQTEQWLYIYIPEDFSNEYPSYIEYSDSHKKPFYKGNHITISYDETCDIILFHYTEYDDTYDNKTYEFCNFKIFKSDVYDLKCVRCVNGTIEPDMFRKTLIEDNPRKSDEVSNKKMLYIFNIIYKIIMLLRHTSKAKKIHEKAQKQMEAKNIKRNKEAKIKSAAARKEREKQALQLSTSHAQQHFEEKKPVELTPAEILAQIEEEDRFKKELKEQNRLKKETKKAAEQAAKDAAAAKEAKLLEDKRQKEEAHNKEAEQYSAYLVQNVRNTQGNTAKLSEILRQEALAKEAKELKKAQRAATRAATKATADARQTLQGGAKKYRCIKKSKNTKK